MQKEIIINANFEIPEKTTNLLKFAGIKFRVIRKNFEYGEGFNYPFMGYPSKLKTETWREWENKCLKMGFNPNTIQEKDVVDKKYTMYALEKTRREADRALEDKKQGKPHYIMLQ